MMWALLFALAQDDPVKVKEPDFEKVKGQFEKYERAARDLESGAFDKARIAAKELLADAAVAGFADRKVQVVRLDRMTRAWTQSVGDPREFYPRQVAARCLLELSKAEEDSHKRLAMLEEARGLIQGSAPDSSRRFESAIAAEHERVRKASETPREDPRAPVIREAQRHRDAKDFKAALGHLEKNKAVLGESYETLRQDVEKAQERYLADLASEAKAFLEKLRPEEKLDALSKAIKSFLPDAEKVTSFGPELEWIRSLWGMIERHKAADYFESVAIGQLSKDLEGLLQAAMAREDVAQVRVAIRIRTHALMAATKGCIDRAAKDPLASLDKHKGELAKLTSPLAVELSKLRKEAEGTSDPGRKTFLGKVADEMGDAVAALGEITQRMPMHEPVIDGVRKAAAEGDAAVFGPEAAGSYRSLIARLKGIIEADAFEKLHPEAMAMARSLLAALLALEGFRDGRLANEIKVDCRPYVTGDFKHVLEAPPKVRKLLDSLKP